jgi:hypothetical protein
MNELGAGFLLFPNSGKDFNQHQNRQNLNDIFSHCHPRKWSDSPDYERQGLLDPKQEK